MEKYEGQDATEKRVLLETRVISLSKNVGVIFYRNEYQLSFDKYITKLQVE